MADLFAAGGKRVRPALVLLPQSAARYDLDRLTPAAMAVELTHAATLVHDDVIDRSAVQARTPDRGRIAGRRAGHRGRRLLLRQGL